MITHSIVLSNGLDRYYCIAGGIMYVYDSQINLNGSYNFGHINGYYPYFNDAVITDDGIVFAGRIGGNAVVLKTDFEFNLVWQSTVIDDSWGSGFNKLQQYSDGWIGVSESLIAFMDSVGDSLWTYSGEYMFQDCILTHDNQVFGIGINGNTGYYCLFDFDHTNQTAEVIPIDNRTMFGVFPPALVEDINGNLIHFDLGRNIEVLHAYSRSGDHLWSRNFYPDNFYDSGYGASNIIPASEGGILFCALGYGGFTLVKTDSNGEVSNDDPILAPATISTAHYPNPASDQITIDYKTESQAGELSLEVFNIRGQMVCSSPLSGSEGSHQLNLIHETGSQFAPGIYLYRIRDEHSGTSISKRFIKTR